MLPVSLSRAEGPPSSHAEAVIVSLAGEKDADLISSAVSGWVDAKKGMGLSRGDRLRTGADTKIRIEFANNAIIDMAKESDVTFSYNQSEYALSARTGYIHGVFNGIGSFEIRTPMLACKASEAEIYLDVFQGIVYATSGTASVTAISAAKRYTLTAGNSIAINSGGSITGPQPYSNASVESIKNTFEVLR